MLDDIHDRLMKAKERLRAKQKLDAMLREERTTLDREREKCRLYGETLSSEKADVDKLEGYGLTGLFYSILGTKDERLEKERQEYLAAKLKYDESVQAVEEIQSEVERLGVELNSCSEAQAEYDRLLEEKRQLLSAAGDGRAEALMDLSERLGDLESDRKELGEAVQAGESAKHSLERVQSALASAKNWGTWDMLGGGGVATWVKHSKIDSAKEEARVAQRRLRQFQEELADADQRLHVSLDDIGGFSKFADFFFDGLIADWIVQSKVQEASGACESALRKVSSALTECRRQLTQVERDAEQVATEKRKFVEGA